MLSKEQLRWLLAGINGGTLSSGREFIGSLEAVQRVGIELWIDGVQVNHEESIEFLTELSNELQRQLDALIAQGRVS
jgi:hypothetical protein